MWKVLALLAGVIGSPAAAAGVCDFGTPHPDAPDGLQQFAFMVGNYRIESRIWQGEAFSEGYLEAEWNARWGLGGAVIIDEWFGEQFGPDIPPVHGVNVRAYDPETNLWNISWQSTSGATVALEARQGDDGVMRLWQVYPEATFESFIYFEIYDDTHWARFEGLVLEDGTHQNRFRRDAFQVPCEG